MRSTSSDSKRTTAAASRRHALFAVFVVGALLFAAFTGCATRQSVVVAKGRGRGTQRNYPVTVDQAWMIAKAVLELEPTEKVEEHRPEGYMVTTDIVSSLTPGTYIGVFVEPDGAEAKVTIVTRRRTPTQAYASLSEGSFHRKFAELVKLIAAVGPLPAETPVDAGGPPIDAAPASSATDGGGVDGGS
jgi:hypothetical protein